MDISLRGYQQHSIDLLTESMRTRHRAPVLVCSTGSGKTRVGAAICRRAIDKGNRVLFITPRRGLTFQASQDFEDLGIENGIIMAGVEHDNRHMVEVASMDTIISRIGKDHITGALLGVEAADLLIIDEAHLSVSLKRKEFLLDVLSGVYGPGKRIIGLTASPCVNGGGGLGGVYDDLLIPISMQELIDQGYLCQPRYYAAEKPDLSSVKITAGDYNKDGLAKAFDTNQIMGDVLSNWVRIAGNSITVVFTPTRATAAHLVERFVAAGYPAEYVDANTSDYDRKAMFDRLRSGRTKVICNVGIVSLGVDIPTIETVVMATATKSVAKWMQAVGRAMRISDGKKYAKIIDHGGMCIDPQMGAVENITEWSLEEKGKVQDRILEAKKEKKEPKEITCSECKTVFKSRRDCPECGHEMKQKTEGLEYYEADLKEVGRNVSKINRQATPEQKEAFFGGLKGYAMKHRYNPGWASHKYKEKYGVWPNKYKNAKPTEPNQEVLNFIRYTQIKWAKSKKSRVA